jgi:hypothetical protein
VKTVIRFSILLSFLLQGFIAIEGANICFDKHNLLQIETFSNCCEQEQPQNSLVGKNDTCEDCIDLTSSINFGECHAVAKCDSFTSQKNVIAPQISLKEIKYIVNFSPHDEFLFSKSNYLPALKKIRLLI